MVSNIYIHIYIYSGFGVWISFVKEIRKRDIHYHQKRKVALIMCIQLQKLQSNNRKYVFDIIKRIYQKNQK